MNVKGQVLQLRDRLDVLELSQRAERPAPPRVRGHQARPRALAAPTLMLAVPGLAEIMRERFVQVPAERIRSAGDRNVTVECQCGRALTLGYGELTRCSCWRFYFNAKTLKVTEPPAPDEIVMCDNCDDDLAHKDGAWIRVAGEDRFVCAACHDLAVKSAAVDLFDGDGA